MNANHRVQPKTILSRPSSLPTVLAISEFIGDEIILRKRTYPSDDTLSSKSVDISTTDDVQKIYTTLETVKAKL